MIDWLARNPLLLLFVVCGVGFLVGRVKHRGTSLGVAAVLFVGLAVGALSPKLRLPEIVYQLGLALFVYTIGLSNGPAFVAALRQHGLKANLAVLGVLLVAAALAIGVGRTLDLSGPQIAGLFAGSLTNTPALATVLDQLEHAGRSTQLVEPVVGYSLAYPGGVLVMLLAVWLDRRTRRSTSQHAAGESRGRDASQAAGESRGAGDSKGAGESPTASEPQADAGSRSLGNLTLRVTRFEATGIPLGELTTRFNWDVAFGRVKRDGVQRLADDAVQLQLGDLVTVVGTKLELARVTAELGVPSDEDLGLDRSQLDYRRVVVSNRRVIGQTLRALNLPQHYGAVVTRIRRGDVEFATRGDSVLQLGDHLRVVAARDRMEAVARYLGDSYRALREIDFATFSLGLALGLVVGAIPIPLPGGLTVRLGLAGGPLVVSMVLGALRRTGNLVWQMPESSNLTLRQTGSVLFLAGVGTRSGYEFVRAVSDGRGLFMLVGGVLLTAAAAGMIVFVGRRWLRLPPGELAGVIAGFQTQPAVLSFALEQSRDDSPSVGYATVYPLATLVKIVLAQLLLGLA